MFNSVTHQLKLRRFLCKVLYCFRENVKERGIILSSFILFLYSIIPSLIISACILQLTELFAPEIRATVGTAAGQSNLNWFPTIIFNPVIESFLLALLVFTSLKLKFNVFFICAIPAALLACLHSIAQPIWGITVFWTFLLHSYAFQLNLTTGFIRAYLIIVFAHALQNSTILIIFKLQLFS